MKNKFLFLVFVTSLFFVFQIKVSSAANDCETAYPGSKCVDTRTYTKEDSYQCIPNHCAGSSNIMCCKNLGPATPISNPATAEVAAASGASGSSTEFTNPLTFDTAEEFLTKLMGWVQGIIVTLSLVAIVVGALMYVTSFGVEKQITQAKEAISAALIGLTLGVAAPSMLKELAGILGWKTADSNVTKALSLSAIALKALNFLLGIFGVLSLIMMLLGASLYLTSAGDEERITKGKDIFKYSVLGVLIAMSAMILVRQIAKFFVA